MGPEPAPSLSAGRRVDPILAVAAAALLLRVASRLLVGAGQYITYDEGVYLSTSALLGRGHVLYRDAAAIHPPGMFLVVAPLTWLGSPSQWVVLGRLLSAILGAASTWVVGDIVRRHRSLVGGVAAAITYAVLPQAVAVERTMLIEPLLNLLLLLAARAWLLAPEGAAVDPAGRRSSGAVAAGCWWGAGLYTKVTAVLIAPAIGVTALVRRRPGRAVVAGAAASSVLVAGLLPVLLGAARPFVEQVLVVQLGRTDGSSLAERMGWALGLGANRVALRALPGTALALVGLVLLVRELRRRAVDELLVFGLVWFGTVIAAFAASEVYYLHYNALLAPSVGLIGGAVGARVAGWVTPARRPLLRVAVGLMALGGVLAPISFRGPIHSSDLAAPDEQEVIAQVLHRHRGCLWTWNPAWLVIGDRLPDIERFGRVATEPWLTDAVYALQHDEPNVDKGGSNTPSRTALARCPYVLARGSDWPELVGTHRIVAGTTADGPSIWERLGTDGAAAGGSS